MIDYKIISAFISTGRDCKMYTLRLNCEKVKNGAKINSDMFWCSLSTDWDKAVLKAKQHCLDLNTKLISTKKFDLEEIMRTKESERKRIQAEAYEKSRELIKKQKQILEEQTEKEISEGVLLAGKYKGSRVEEVFATDPSYVRYMAYILDDVNSTDKNYVTCKICKDFLVKTNPKESDYVGVVGESISGSFKLTKRVSFNGAYGKNYAHVFLTEQGSELLLYTSSKKFLDIVVGSYVNLEAIVKEHKINNTLTKETLITKAKLV